MIVFSIGLNIVFTLGGLALAYRFNLTSGAAVILVAATGFFLFFGLERLRGRSVRRKARAGGLERSADVPSM
jgi:zinc transport system permease protein